MVKFFEDVKKNYGYKRILLLSLLSVFIITFVDEKNLISYLVNHNYLWLMILGFLIIIIYIFNFKNFVKFKSKCVNNIDVLLLSLLLSITIYFGYLVIIGIIKYRLIILIILGIVVLSLLIIRLIVLNKENDYKSNVLDLKEIYENKVDITNKNFIFLDEKEVSYDLLNRNNIINQLYNTLIRCNPSRIFTIGLQGSWGVGKTTIVNNAIGLLEKNKVADLFVIVKFNPWDYDNEKAMLKGLIDKILGGMNIDYKLENINQLVDSIIEVVFYDNKPNISNFLKLVNNNITNKYEVENMVNNYLQNENKKLLLIVDNMDRIDIEKIKFLLKSISTILNFEKTICVLLYDDTIIERELNKMFGTSDSNAKYLDKIIQLRIDVPQVDVETINLVKNRVSENLTFDGKPILNDVLDKNIFFSNLRELKIFVNNILSSIDTNTANCLDFKDMMNLDFIKSKNSDLYYSIWNNKNFYITDDRYYDINIYTLDYDELNKKAKEYFDDLFKDNRNLKFKDLLINMFPNVNNYFEKKTIFNSNYRNIDEYNNGIKQNKIYNARYFDLYFTKSENDFIWINKEVKGLIQIINNKSKNKFGNKLKKIINKYNYDELKVMMEVFELHTIDIKESKRLEVINLLYKNIYNFPDRVLFLGLDSRRRCQIIIAKLINMSSINLLEEFCSNVSNDYRNLNIIDEIKYWISKESNKKDESIEMITNKYNEMCLNILANNINIYEDDYYAHSNIWSLYRYDNELTKEYLSKNISKENIYRFLRDTISISIGTGGYGYSIRKESIDLLAKDIDIDKYLKDSNKELTGDELFIKELYDFYKVGNKKYEDSIYKNEYIEFKDI